MGDQGDILPVQDPPYRPEDAARWCLIDAARANMIAPPGVIDRTERELKAAPCGQALASIPHSAQWMQNLGAAMERYGLTNDTAVLIGSEEQLYFCDNRAKIGEIEHDLGTEEFPIR